MTEPVSMATDSGSVLDMAIALGLFLLGVWVGVLIQRRKHQGAR